MILSPERRALVLKWGRLVPWAAQRLYQGRKIPEDALAEGMVGLVIAAHRFDFARGVEFNTYAVFWVRALIIEFMRVDRFGQVSPVNSRTDKALRKAYKRDGGEDLEQVSEESGVSVKALTDAVQRLKARDKSLDALPFVDEDGEPRLFELVDPHPRPDEVCEVGDLAVKRKRIIGTALDQLSPRERKIIEQRYLCEEPLTLVEVAERLERKSGGVGVTRERVRQIEDRALEKLRLALKGVAAEIA